MQPATADTVLGDFEAAALGLSRRGGQFFVGTEEAQYTFGVYPLQQYLVAEPGGRLQVFGLAWDVRAGRWFDPASAAESGTSVPAWHGRGHSWNSMCASCHSTALRKGYDAAHDRFDTTFAEQHVACEACHGPASEHLAWTRTRGTAAAHGFETPLRAASALTFRFEPGQTTAHAAGGHGAALGDPAAEIGRCAPCHSRREELTEAPRPSGPVLDDYAPSLLEQPLYHVDGQLDDESFEYGSFAQSKMFVAGVTCSHCHAPHSGKLVREGNALCAQCHAAEHYDQASHHHHAQASSGAQCVSCHMPSHVFMGVHARRDHAIRVPRPALSAELGTPDACAACHDGKPRGWSAEIAAGWAGEPGTGKRAGPRDVRAGDAACGARSNGLCDVASADARFGRAVRASTAAVGGASDLLAEVASDTQQAPIRRATALSRLRAPLSSSAQAALRDAVHAPDALLRLGAARALDTLDPRTRVELGTPLVSDAARAVRIEAARALIDVRDTPPSPQLQAAFEEWRRAREHNADHPEAHLDLAQVYARLGRSEDAERELRQALTLDPSSVAARVNLADLERARGRDVAAEALLREAVALQPEAAVAWHALGLTLVRLQRRAEALVPLARAAELAPEQADYALAYRLAAREAAARR